MIAATVFISFMAGSCGGSGSGAGTVPPPNCAEPGSRNFVDHAGKRQRQGSRFHGNGYRLGLRLRLQYSLEW